MPNHVTSENDDSLDFAVIAAISVSPVISRRITPSCRGGHIRSWSTYLSPGRMRIE